MKPPFKNQVEEVRCSQDLNYLLVRMISYFFFG